MNRLKTYELYLDLDSDLLSVRNLPNHIDLICECFSNQFNIVVDSCDVIQYDEKVVGNQIVYTILFNMCDSDLQK